MKEQLEQIKAQALQAIHAAADAAQPGDVVLLSPAAAAFDKFKNFMVRGKEFKKTVMAL